MGDVNSQFILSLLIIALGYTFKRFGIINERDGEGIARLIFNVTLPALVITTFSQIVVDFSLLSLALMHLVFGLFMTFIAIYIFRKEERQLRGMLSMTLPGANIGLFAYPLVESIWGQEGLKYIAMFDMGNSLIVFGACFILGSFFSSDEGPIDLKSIIKRMARSIPLITYIGTLGLNILGFQFPKMFIDMTSILARANMALSLLLLGIFLSFTFEGKYWKSIGKVLSLRYSIGLAFGVLLYFVWPYEPILSNTLLIAFILPIGMSTLPYSVQFNYDRRFIGTLINMTIVISFFLVWIIFAMANAV